MIPYAVFNMIDEKLEMVCTLQAPDDNTANNWFAYLLPTKKHHVSACADHCAQRTY